MFPRFYCPNVCLERFVCVQKKVYCTDGERIILEPLGFQVLEKLSHFLNKTKGSSQKILFLYVSICKLMIHSYNSMISTYSEHKFKAVTV